jgi:dienelactone hydrolase
MPSRRTLLTLLTIAATPATATAREFPLRAADGTTIGATFTEAPRSPPRGTLLLFHMAGSNRAEYAPLAPEFARRGFASLAIDARSGGSAFGARNETAARLGRDPGFLAALPDLEAALAWARAEAPGPLIACGSSYSAALVFLLAQRHPGQLAAILAFSPGEYLSGTSVRGAAARIDAPAFVTSAADPIEVAEARPILAAVPDRRSTQFVPPHGVHGASTLRADRNSRGAAANWAALDAFLDRVVPPP